MPDPDRPEGPDHIAAVAEQVIAGQDSIAVPPDLIEEKSPGPPTTPRPDAARPHEKAMWALIREMSMGERIKLALRGNKESRMVLLRDTNPQIQRLVLQNPRISEDEILMVCKDRNTDEEILALLADSRDWVKLYSVRVTLVENARTPVAKSLRLLATLDEKDLSRLGKSKAVPNVIAVQARRMLFQLRERRR